MSDRNKDWATKYLVPRLIKLKKMQKTASGNQLLIIQDTIETIEEVLRMENRRVGTGELYRLARNSINRTTKFSDLFKPLASVPYPQIHITNRVFPDLSNDDLMGLMYEFFERAMDDDFFRRFKAQYDRRKKLVHFGNYNIENADAEMIYLRAFDEAHIAVRRTGMIDDFSGLAHEYGHALEYSMNYQPSMFFYDMLSIEVVSSFFEILSLDFLKGDKYFKNQAMQALDMRFFCIISDLQAYFTQAKLFDKWDKIKGPQKRKDRIISEDLREYKDDLGLSEGERSLRDLLLRENSEIPKYAIGWILAVEIFMLYIKDPEKGIELLHRYMELDLLIDDKYLFKDIKRMGIKANRHMDDFIAYTKDPKMTAFRR